MTLSFVGHGVPPCWRAYFLLLRQKKVAKGGVYRCRRQKATPGYAVGYADSPALLETPGGCGTRGYAPQTVIAEGPRRFCVARRSTWGPERRPGSTGKRSISPPSFKALDTGFRRCDELSDGRSVYGWFAGPLERR